MMWAIFSTLTTLTTSADYGTMDPRAYRKFHKCTICKIIPHMQVAKILEDNCDSYININNSEQYLLCDLCERYCHFKCLYELIDITDTQVKKGPLYVCFRSDAVYLWCMQEMQG